MAPVLRVNHRIRFSSGFEKQKAMPQYGAWFLLEVESTGFSYGLVQSWHRPNVFMCLLHRRAFDFVFGCKFEQMKELSERHFKVVGGFSQPSGVYRFTAVS